MENIDIIKNLIDEESRGLVGILCKRIELLEKENQLTPSLYKSLAKEHIYEFARQLKKLVYLHTQIGKLEFKVPKSKEE